MSDTILKHLCTPALWENINRDTQPPAFLNEGHRAVNSAMHPQQIRDLMQADPLMDAVLALNNATNRGLLLAAVTYSSIIQTATGDDPTHYEPTFITDSSGVSDYGRVYRLVLADLPGAVLVLERRVAGMGGNRTQWRYVAHTVNHIGGIMNGYQSSNIDTGLAYGVGIKPFLRTLLGRWRKYTKNAPAENLAQYMERITKTARGKVTDAAAYAVQHFARGRRDALEASPRLEFTDAMAHTVYEVLSGGKTIDALPEEMKSSVMQACENYSRVTQRRHNAITEIRQKFAKEFWVVAHCGRLGIMVGAIDLTKMAEYSIENPGSYTEPGNNTCAVTVPFRYCLSMTQMPEDIHDDVRGTMAAIKMYREGKPTADRDGVYGDPSQESYSQSDNHRYIRETDPEGLYIWGDGAWFDVETWSRNFSGNFTVNEWRYMFFPK